MKGYFLALSVLFIAVVNARAGPPGNDCTAVDMSKRSEFNEHCFNCRECLQDACLESGAWPNKRHWCHFLLNGERKGRPEDWLACLESDGSSRTLADPVAGQALIEANGGNRDTWGACARTCDNKCSFGAVIRTATDNPICTSLNMATSSTKHSDVCYPCRQCLRRHCEDDWSGKCERILKGLESGTQNEWLQCLEQGGNGGLRRRNLEERDQWGECARKCDIRCHHAVPEGSVVPDEPDEPEPTPEIKFVEPLCRTKEGYERFGTPVSRLPPSDKSLEPLIFRERGSVGNGRYSYETYIKVVGGGWNNVHAELTSRPIQHGETFEVEAQPYRYQVGAGLCIESCDMKNETYGIRFNYNCVGFYGDNPSRMFAADAENKEYIINKRADNRYSSRQGFTYDAVNNCVTHVSSPSKACTPLPRHFKDKVVRAIGQVWNGQQATIVSHPVPTGQ